NDNPNVFNGAEGISAEVMQKVIDFSQNNKLFGLIDLGAIPDTVFQTNVSQWTPALWGLFLIPIFTGLIQLAMTIYSTIKQKKLNPEASSQMGSMNIILYGMSIFFIYVTFKSPAALGFYWICSSIVGFLQTFILNKIYTPEYVAKLIEKDKLKNKNKKKSGFMEKYNEMLQEQLKQQNGGNASAGNRNITASKAVKDDEDGENIKLSKSQVREYERKIIAEARRRQAEKYGDEYTEDDE
ncbi:MAG: YidC/Oxa1 family membrane protein insertase, partial [Huintestinicola sp.]